MWNSNSLKETSAIASKFIESLSPAIDPSKALVVGLIGELGSGKTTFVKKCANTLGVMDVVNSPTFAILKEYKTNTDKFTSLTHIDAYRINGKDDSIAFADYFKKKGSLVFVEWPGNIKEQMPVRAIYLRFDVVGENKRDISRTSIQDES